MCAAEKSVYELQGLLHKSLCIIVPNDGYLVQEQQELLSVSTRMTALTLTVHYLGKIAVSSKPSKCCEWSNTSEYERQSDIWRKTPQTKAVCALRLPLEETNLETVACQLPEQLPCSLTALTDHDEPACLGHMNRACESTAALGYGGLAVAA